MILETIYMIRNGNFGTNYETKFYMSLIAIGLCIWDWKQKERKDYFGIYLVGTIIWGGLEFALQITGTRDIITVYLFDWELPIIIASVLRGTSEGATIAIIGIFCGDRLLNSKQMKSGILFLSIIITVVFILTFLQANTFRDIGGLVASRRDIFQGPAVILLTIFIIFDLLWYWKTTPLARKRAIWMFLVMTFFSTFWTVSEYLAKTRWIEVGSNSIYLEASMGITLLAFAWDIIVEISFCYLPYFAIPYLFHWIKDKSELS